MSFSLNYRILVVSLCLLVQVFGKTDSAVPCQDTKKFHLALEPGNFFEALVSCKEGGMELASIENEDESAALDSFLDPYKIGGSPNGFWLSGTNSLNPFSFQYYWLSTGAKAIYTQWVTSQPDNAHGLEHCLEWVWLNGTGEVGWNDYNCNITLRYVCQYISNSAV